MRLETHKTTINRIIDYYIEGFQVKKDGDLFKWDHYICQDGHVLIELQIREENGTYEGMNFQQIMKTRRLDLGLTLSQAGDALKGKSKSYVWELENKRVSIGAKVCQSISVAYDIDINILIDAME